MRKRLNLWIDVDLIEDFRKHVRGSISSFLEDKMAEKIEHMRLNWWLICPSCGEKSHVRIVLNNDGLCTKVACKGQIAEKIDQ